MNHSSSLISRIGTLTQTTEEERRGEGGPATHSQSTVELYCICVLSMCAAMTLFSHYWEIYSYELTAVLVRFVNQLSDHPTV